MNAPSPSARAYRRLGYLAVAHAVAVFGLGFLLLSGGSEDAWRERLWVGLVTLWFFWPVVLALHHGRSALRFTVFVAIAAFLMLPTLRLYSMIAPWTLGFPMGLHMNPLSAWQYFSAYRAGRADAEKDVAAGILAIEEFGFGAGSGPEVRILRERYQIELRAVAQCLVDETIFGHVAGYNEVSGREIDRRVGRDRVAAAREEGARLEVEQRERQEQYSKDLANRLSSFSSDSKIALESVETWVDGGREISTEVEQELGPFVRAVERFIAEPIPQDTAMGELRVSSTLKPIVPPKFDAPSCSACPRPVYEKIYENLPNLTLPQWNSAELSVAMRFTVRETH